MDFKSNIFFVLFIIFINTVTVACKNHDEKNVDSIINSINLSAEYLRKSVQDSGKFVYRTNMDSSISVKDKYNILRHSGTIYAMTMHYQLNRDPRMLSAILKAGSYLNQEFIYSIADNDFFAVWSNPEINNTNDPLQAKLGGTGLGLVALLSIEKIQPRFTPLKTLQNLGNFIIYMQKQDGSFYSKYIPSDGGLWDQWESLYYPGEAALGLMMLYELDPSDKWLNSAIKAIEYLALKRKGNSVFPADHWALLATEKILSIKKIDPVTKDLLIDHAIYICDSILDEQIHNNEINDYNGGFSIDGRTTPTATRLEGLLASLNFLPKNHELIDKINDSIPQGIFFLNRAQVNNGDFIGATPRAILEKDQSLENAHSFNKRVTEVRIDYIQHSLSAMIQYLLLIQKDL